MHSEALPDRCTVFEPWFLDTPLGTFLPRALSPFRFCLGEVGEISVHAVLKDRSLPDDDADQFGDVLIDVEEVHCPIGVQQGVVEGRQWKSLDVPDDFAVGKVPPNIVCGIAP